MTKKDQVANAMRRLIAAGHWPIGQSVGDLGKLEQQSEQLFGFRACHLDPAAPGRIEHAVPRGGHDAPVIERVHLVFHEREERGDHDGKAAKVHRRQLIAERLPAPGSQDRERVVSANDRDYDRFLVRAESRIAPVFHEQGKGSFLWSG